ncbi:MAG: hypothetical protein R6V62_07575 [Candidatus Fermentibacteraceae bacterium]
MSESLESLLEAEARAAEILERAGREALAERNSIPAALKELEDRYESALAAAEEREKASIATETLAYREELGLKRKGIEERLRERSRELRGKAFELLQGRILRGD